MSKRLGGIIDYKYKTSSWCLNGFPMVVTLGQQYNVGEKPTVMYTLFFTFSALVAHQRKLLYTVICRLLFLTFNVLVTNPSRALN